MSSILTQHKRFNLVVLVLGMAGIGACTTTERPERVNMSFSADPLLGKIVWHDLITEDLDGAKAFYGGLFGWEFESAQGVRGERYLLARSGDVFVAGLLDYDAPADDENYSRWLPYVSVDSVDAALARGEEAGGQVAAAARNVRIGRVAAMIDPQGAVIGLARSMLGDPDDATTAAAPGRPVWTELLANDTAAAAAFYQSLAPYQSETLKRRGGEYIVLNSGGAARAGIFENPGEGRYTPAWITAFGVQDPAAAAARAETLGAKILLPVSPDLRDGTTAVVSDPTGAILVLQAWTRNGAES